MVKNNKLLYIYYITLFIISFIINYLFMYNLILYNNIEIKFKIILLIISIIFTLIINKFIYSISNKKLFIFINIIFYIYINILIFTNYKIKNNINLNNINNNNKNLNHIYKNYNKPFTLLLINNNKNNNINNNLNIITFNPQKNIITLLNIPNNTYLNIKCIKNRKNRIIMYNDDCIMNTLNNTFKINIDYYIKLDFNQLFKIFDNDYINQYNFLKNNTNNKISIISNNNKSIINFINLINSIKNNNNTNLSNNTLLSFYKIINNITNIKIQKLFLNGYNEYIYDYDYINNSGTKLTLYNYIPYIESINQISKYMNDNINGKMIISNKIIGNIKGNKIIKLMPNFINKSYNDINDFCKNNNIELFVNYVSGDNIGKIISQSIQENSNLEYVKNITINLIDNKKEILNNNISNNNISNNNISNNNISNNNISNNNDKSILPNNNYKDNNLNNEKDIDPIINNFLY